MKRAIGMFGVFSILSLGAGCAATPIKGKPLGAASIYSEVQFNESITQNAVGSKQGMSCATNILGIIANGDASAAAAAKQAGINQIATVDAMHNNILGVYSKYCVVVSGD